MKSIYLDEDYKCHIVNEDGMKCIETDYFDGKCPAYIEGYRFVPSGSTWVRSDGAIFQGEMVAPWKPWEELDSAQREYERAQYATLSAQNAEYEAALSEIETALGVK